MGWKVLKSHYEWRHQTVKRVLDSRADEETKLEPRGPRVGEGGRFGLLDTPNEGNGVEGAVGLSVHDLVLTAADLRATGGRGRAHKSKLAAWRTEHTSV